MKLHTLVLEGDQNAEKEKKEAHLPVHTKGDYLRRKWVENRPPLHARSFYLCRMIAEALRGIDIDGSGKLTICAHQVRCRPGTEKYICDRKFHISIYYLEREEILALEEVGEDTEAMVMWEILRSALLDIAQRNHCADGVMEDIKGAFEHILNSHFVREEPIAKLTKRNRTTGLTARVYRVLSPEAGEGWYLNIVDRKGTVHCQAAIDGGARYVDRLGSRLYARSEWRGDTFVILERFGKEVFRISVPPRL